MIRNLVSIYLGAFAVMNGVASMILIYGGIDPGNYSHNATIFGAALAVHVGQK